MSTDEPLKTYYVLRCFDPPVKLGPTELRSYAEEIGLRTVAPGRISSLLLAQIFAYSHRYGIEPYMISAEIKHLEGVSGYEQSQTKPATPFKESGQLAGLSHKHFTASTIGIVAGNILAERPKKLMMIIAEEEFANGATNDALQRFTDRIVIEGYERRAESDRLTGEWIVFVEHEGLNYYLCLATHSGANTEVLNYLQTVVRHEFPFLAAKFPHLFAKKSAAHEARA